MEKISKRSPASIRHPSYNTDQKPENKRSVTRIRLADLYPISKSTTNDFCMNNQPADDNTKSNDIIHNRNNDNINSANNYYKSNFYDNTMVDVNNPNKQYVIQKNEELANKEYYHSLRTYNNDPNYPRSQNNKIIYGDYAKNQFDDIYMTHQPTNNNKFGLNYLKSDLNNLNHRIESFYNDLQNFEQNTKTAIVAEDQYAKNEEKMIRNKQNSNFRCDISRSPQKIAIKADRHFLYSNEKKNTHPMTFKNNNDMEYSRKSKVERKSFLFNKTTKISIHELDSMLQQKYR